MALEKTHAGQGLYLHLGWGGQELAQAQYTLARRAVQIGFQTKDYSDGGSPERSLVSEKAQDQLKDSEGPSISAGTHLALSDEEGDGEGAKD